jgi:CRISPR-associated endonuclease/helicase Cas3
MFAHSTSDPDKRDWQPLADHLSAVADLAAERGCRIGVEGPARLAGLLHDLGKYAPEFQARLEGNPTRVDHSTAGAAWVLRSSHLGAAPLRELVAHAVAGHHAGLPDRRGSDAGLDARLEGFDLDTLDLRWRAEIEPRPVGDASPLARRRFATPGFRFALLGRMIFSCLVDADFRDTEAFYDRIGGITRDRSAPALGDVLSDLLARFDAEITRLADGQNERGSSPVDALRREILEAVLGRAGNAPGLFTLTVPTGGGKTLASLGFALRHAATHGLDRVIYVAPFTSIVDQTADVFRRVLGEEIVLEHHSAIEETGERAGRASGRDKLRLAMEDWSFPVIATTQVQFFESLFAARPSRCRKLHNVARSVVVLDEAQTIPRRLLGPAFMALEALAGDWGTTVVLCTATQPALVRTGEDDRRPAALPLEGRELAPDPTGLAQRLRRTQVRFAGAMDDHALVEALAGDGQGLVIVNSRAHALDLWRSARETGLEGLVHLSTRQCAADRRILLAEIREVLQSGRACRVIATSLVEAGVDVDFPRVWRAATGLDQIAQAAGRCNREGRRPADESLVTVFEAPDHPPPPEIRRLAADFERVRGRHADLTAPEALADWFEEVYWRTDEDLDRERIVDALKFDGRETDLAFRSVAERFRMVESGLEPVIVPADETATAAIRDLAVEAVPSGTLARRLQSYTVPVPPKARRRLIEAGHVVFVEPRLRGEQFAVLTTPSLYTQEVGLLWEDADYLGHETIVI